MILTKIYLFYSNQGMHDQVAALQWVQDYIECFGGDKSNVTIMGESAGAMSCFLHYVSPLSRGLFHKVIALSGSATTPFLHNDRKPSVYARSFAQSLGLNYEDSATNLVKELQTLRAKDLVKKCMVFKDWDNNVPMPWKPVVDDYSSHPFLPRPFADIIQAQDFDKTIPILAGTVGEEGLIYTAPFQKSAKKWRLLFSEWEKWAPQVLFNRETDLITEGDIKIVNAVYDHLFKSREVMPKFSDENLQKLEQIFSTIVFHAPFLNDIEKMVEHGVNAHIFRFSYRGSFSIVDIFRLPSLKLGVNFMGRMLGMKLYQKDLGTCHADDIMYIFPMSHFGLPQALKTEMDVSTSKRFVRYLTNFAKGAEPTPTATDVSEDNLLWDKYDIRGRKEILMFEADGSVTVKHYTDVNSVPV